ncbi:penicillin-binding protein 2 [Candidatus Microgenomates bacterium]|nr:penicillin-binding protein 2 [Candidatus Microgenomates bacterium]
MVKELSLFNSRFRLINILFLICFSLLILRLFYWQILKNGELSKYARAQHVTSVEISAHRGAILASDGAPLATSQINWQMWTDPQKIKENKDDLAHILASLLADNEDQLATGSARVVLVATQEAKLKKALANKDLRWVSLADKVSDESKNKINGLHFDDLGWTAQESRYYPEGTMAAHLLGFVGKSETGEEGYFGLEGFYDVTLSGKKGIRREEKDLRGNPIPFGLLSEIGAQKGLDIVTFIDRTIQYTAVKHLQEAMDKYGAKGGSVVVMKPTGEVLAAASLPSYDAAKYNQSDPTLFKNPIVSDAFEPGSIFKILVMAAALDSGAVTPKTKCDNCSGPVSVAEYQIHTGDNKYFPNTTMAETIIHSDNTGMVFTVRRLGQEKLLDYLSRFGIGRITGIDLQEEESPTLRPLSAWTSVDLATSAFGQGVAVTPIQFTRAAAAIANHGILPIPRVVDKITGDGWSQSIPVRDEGRVISEKAASEISEMMTKAVQLGEARRLAIPGFAVAGKTGTAQVPLAGHYSKKTVASFIGFAPAQNPQFVMLVSLQEPSSSPWASQTAAPTWFAIARDLFPYLGISPSQ